mmetsp:Transcript_48790/g.153127  ORF Transcript_48790/g.153127 Transcript_48790/m.153127 type:complete len:229 (+) Transcript_48790:993-1679(+)
MIQGQLRVDEARHAYDLVHLSLKLQVLPVLVLRSLRHHLKRVRQPHHLLAQLVQLRVTFRVLLLQAADARHPLSLRQLVVGKNLRAAVLLESFDLLLCGLQGFLGSIQGTSQLCDLLLLRYGFCFAGVEQGIHLGEIVLEVGDLGSKLLLLPPSHHMVTTLHAVPIVARLVARLPLATHGSVQHLHLLCQTGVLSLRKLDFDVQLPTTVLANEEATFKFGTHRLHVVS